MSNALFLARAASSMAEIIRDIKPDQLDAPTPCALYDVRGLLNHLMFWGPSLEGAGRKETLPPPAAAEADLDITHGDWASALVEQLERTAAAWSTPEAWEGTTHMGGPTELPSSLVGGMVVVEIMVHGWDLARATGSRQGWDDDLLRYVREEIPKSAEQGREMGLFGPEIAVPAGSSVLDHLLGMTGRDPAWRPAG